MWLLILLVPLTTALSSHPSGSSSFLLPSSSLAHQSLASGDSIRKFGVVLGNLLSITSPVFALSPSPVSRALFLPHLKLG